MMKRRAINVRAHTRISSLGKQYSVRRHRRRILMREQERSRIDRPRFEKRDKINYFKDPPAKIVQLKLKAGREANQFQLKNRPDIRSAKYSNDFLDHLSNYYPNLVGFVVEEQWSAPTSTSSRKKQVLLIPIFAYSQEQLSDPDVHNAIMRDIENFVTQMNNEMKDEFFSNKRNLNPEVDYFFYSGKLLGNLKPKDYQDKNDKTQQFYEFDFFLAEIRDDGSVAPYTRANAVLIPDAEKKSKTGAYMFRRKHTGPGNLLWRDMETQKNLEQYAKFCNEYKSALQDYQDKDTRQNRERVRTLERKLIIYQNIAKKYYIEQGKDIVVPQPFPITAENIHFKAKEAPEDRFFSYKGKEGLPIAVSYTHPDSFNLIDAKKRKVIDREKMQKDAEKRLKELTDMKLKSKPVKSAFYIDLLHYYDLGSPSKNIEFEKRYPLGAYKYEQKKEGDRDRKKWKKKHVDYLVSSSMPFEQRENAKRNIVWVDTDKTNAISVIRDPNETMVNRQREWNRLVKRSVRSSVWRNKDLQKIKLLKREPVSWTPSEVKLVKELTGLSFVQKPGKNMVFTPSPFTEVRVTKIGKEV